MKKIKELVKDILFLFVVILVFNIVISKGLAKTEYKTCDYTVKDGDTVWNIASDICNENNELYIKNVVSDIRKINELDEPTIYAGQVIMLPIYN